MSPSSPAFIVHRASLRTVLVAAAVVGFVPSTSSASPIESTSSPVIEIREARPRADRGLGRYVSEGSVLARFDFEGGDPQGWQTVDTQQAGRNHWHVDDFVGLDPGYAPLAGQQSIWCGVRPEEVPPGWTHSDGYGNDWNDVFQVQEFSAPTGAVLTMLLRYDLEDQEDWLYVEYRHGDGPWEQLAAFTGRQPTTIQPVLAVQPPADPGDLTTIRWRVVTDEVGSDEYLGIDSNGAAILDDIDVRDALGNILRFENFEGEAVGDQTTINGWFFAPPREPTEIGNRGALVSGIGVLQEDPLGPNDGHFWSFYQNSVDTYRCGIQPTQPALPRALDLADPVFSNSLRNRLQSPWVDLNQVVEGDPNVGIQPRLELSMRAYLDNPSEEEVYFRFELRWKFGGVEIPEWRVVPVYYFGSSRQWSNYVYFFDIPEGASHVQVGITVFDLAWSRNPDGAAGLCHSHAPLIDDITIGRAPRASIRVTNANDDGPGSLRQAIQQANAAPGPDRILFDIQGASHVISTQSPLPLVTGPCVIDATLVPGHDGVDRVSVTQGYSSFTGQIGLALGDSVVVRGLSIHGFDRPLVGTTSAAVQIFGSDNVIEDCWIGVRPDGVLDPNDHGILLWFGAERNRIGGSAPEQSNRIEGNGRDGIRLVSQAGGGNTIRGNRIAQNGRLAVDLGGDGGTSNDPGDLDTGPNGYQNHPEVTSVNGPLGRIEATLTSRPSTAYVVDFYRDTVCGFGSRGQGLEYLGGTEITTDASGGAVAILELGQPLPLGDVIVATATDMDGSTSEYSTCGLVEQTPAGSNVLALVEGGPAGTTVLFPVVTAAGTTSATASTSYPPLPEGYDPGASPVYDLVTDCSHAGILTVCLGYDETSIAGGENELALLHYDAGAGAWQDVTSSRDPAANVVCGMVDSLSPFVVATRMGATDVDVPVHRARELLPNVPNPFNPRTRVRFTLPDGERVRLEVVDVAGRTVDVLSDARFPAGSHEVVWDGTDAEGRAVASGIYFARLRGEGWVRSIKMALVR